MIHQVVIEHGLARDVTLVFVWMSVVMISYLTIKVGMRIKEASLISATTGFTLFLITFEIFLLLSSLPFLYPEFETNLMYTISSFLFLGGMISFILLLEVDNLNTSSKNNDKKIKYRLTAITLVITIVILP